MDSVNLWVSIGSTHSNLHYDSKHGLLVMLRGCKRCEVFAPRETKRLHAFPVSDPLRSHHAAVPHSCLAARFGSGACDNGRCCCKSMERARGWQTVL